MLLRIYKAARYIQNGPSYYNSHTSNKEGLKKVLFRHSCFLPRESHCVVKFRSNYGDLDWDSTWKTWFSCLSTGNPLNSVGTLPTVFCTLLTVLFLSD